MLTREENEILTGVGRGTPGGRDAAAVLDARGGFRGAHR